MITVILNGFLLAVGLILPLGVQNFFVFNQGATQPRFYKVLTVVITASICDTILIVLAIYGVSLVVLGMHWIEVTLLGFGIIFLFYMGWVTWNSRPRHENNVMLRLSLKQIIVFTSSVSLLNPHAILDTIGVIGTNSLQYLGIEKAAFALTCVFVSWSWFLGLAFAGRLVGKIDHSDQIIVFMSRVSAIIIWATACYLGFSLFH
ncbi:MAG: Lysine exporter protein [Paenibacillus sp.]|jgi:L-lysine exporter family protein LysE/ArgO|nr:Lysine exporter protein [Paenibacillus sp.]